MRISPLIQYSTPRTWKQWYTTWPHAHQPTDKLLYLTHMKALIHTSTPHRHLPLKPQVRHGHKLYYVRVGSIQLRSEHMHVTSWEHPMFLRSSYSLEQEPIWSHGASMLQKMIRPEERSDGRTDGQADWTSCREAPQPFKKRLVQEGPCPIMKGSHADISKLWLNPLKWLTMVGASASIFCDLLMPEAGGLEIKADIQCVSLI